LQPSASGSVAPPGTMPHVHGQVDYDAADEMNYFAVSGPVNPPVAQNSFPNFTNGYGNGSGPPPPPPGPPQVSTERFNHPLNYNYFQTAGDDRLFGLSNMEALLRYGDSNSPSLTSDLFRLCPVNFQGK